MVKVLIPSGALGLGYDPAALRRGVEQSPDVIAIDGGSTDSGPHYLGTGTSKYSRATVKAEWTELMDARERAGVPLLIGTAGTCGSDDSVDWMLDITHEIAAERSQRLKIATLKSGQPMGRLTDAFHRNQIHPLEHAPALSESLLESCTNVVALAGAEQIQAALATDADIVIAGRTTDTAIIAALPLAHGCHPGGAWHGAKIGECGALATTNPNTGTIMLDFDDEGFTITPMGDATQATPRTVSAHMLYENSDPHRLYEPGGYLDVSEARYQAVDDRRVRVIGSRWRPTNPYTVKLEGTRKAGHQTVTMVLIRDAHYVKNVHEWLAKVRDKLLDQPLDRQSYSLEFRVIGDNATLGALETKRATAHEVGVLAIVTAHSQALADEIAKMLNPYLLHLPLTENEPMPTFAFPFSPAEISRGEVYEFCLFHVLELNSPMDAFRLETIEIG
ncbi:MAG: acyclic terpene utilization AtuA family protein [Pseudomonadota bacterium]